MATATDKKRLQYQVVDLPWGMKHPGVRYDVIKKVHLYEGSQLPHSLEDFGSEDYSYQRWIEDDLNRAVRVPQRGMNLFTPRDHQVVAAKEIFRAFAKGWPGFLEADKTGLGKTLSTLSGVASIISKDPRFKDGKRIPKMLVVCPKRVIPVWRNTLRAYPLAGQKMRVMVTNYQSLLKLIEPPPEAAKAKKKRTKDRLIVRKGKPRINFDFIIFDESHYLKNYPSSTVSLAAANVGKLEEPYIRGKSPFVISATATPGATPLNFATMAPWLARLLDPKSESAKRVTPGGWGSFLEELGFAVTEGKVGWNWAVLPFWGKDSEDIKAKRAYEKKFREVKAQQRHDASRIGKALTTEGAPFIMRSPKDIAGWPEQQIIPLPIELDSDGRFTYKEAWDRFRDFLRLPPSKQDSKSAMVENLRYRQKSSLLKVPSMVEQVIDWVDQDFQVYISCEFTETIEKYAEGLDKAKIPYVITSGATKNVEIPRIAFQKGRAKVVLSTLLEGVSFHSKEQLPDGTLATSNPRITVMSDLRQNNLSNEQAFGRCHRDGENSVLYIPYFADTVDERIITSFANKTANMRKMTGESDEQAEMLETIFSEVAQS